MKKLMSAAAIAIVLAAGLSAAPALAETTSDTATVGVSLTILPYAQVTLWQSSLSIMLPAGPATFGPVYVGATIVCNCPVLLFAHITAPPGAPGDWDADAMVGGIASPGEHPLSDLLRIVVWNIPDGYGGGTFDVGVSGKSAGGIGEVETPPAGEATITVVPDP